MKNRIESAHPKQKQRKKTKAKEEKNTENY